MNKGGFSLLELMIALSISTLVVIVLVMSFDQLQKVLSLSQEYSAIDAAAVVIKNQFEKDISAVFIPLEYMLFRERIKKEKEEPKKDTQNVQASTLFVSSAKDKKFDSLSFITTHALQTVAPDRSKKPFMAQVSYSLKKRTNTQLLSLIRSEKAVSFGDSKNKNPSAPEQSYEVSMLIKKFECTYLYEKEEKKPEETAQKNISTQKIEKKTEMQTVDSWNAEESEQKKLPLLPVYVQVVCVISDELSQREKQYTWIFKIPAAAYAPVIKQKQVAAQPPGGTQITSKPSNTITATLPESPAPSTPLSFNNSSVSATQAVKRLLHHTQRASS